MAMGFYALKFCQGGGVGVPFSAPRRLITLTDCRLTGSSHAFAFRPHPLTRQQGQPPHRQQRAGVKGNFMHADWLGRAGIALLHHLTGHAGYCCQVSIGGLVCAGAGHCVPGFVRTQTFKNCQGLMRAHVDMSALNLRSGADAQQRWHRFARLAVADCQLLEAQLQQLPSGDVFRASSAVVDWRRSSACCNRPAGRPAFSKAPKLIASQAVSAWITR